MLGGVPSRPADGQGRGPGCTGRSGRADGVRPRSEVRAQAGGGREVRGEAGGVVPGAARGPGVPGAAVMPDPQAPSVPHSPEAKGRKVAQPGRGRSGPRRRDSMARRAAMALWGRLVLPRDSPPTAPVRAQPASGPASRDGAGIARPAGRKGAWRGGGRGRGSGGGGRLVGLGGLRSGSGVRRVGLVRCPQPRAGRWRPRALGPLPSPETPGPAGAS